MVYPWSELAHQSKFTTTAMEFIMLWSLENVLFFLHIYIFNFFLDFGESNSVYKVMNIKYVCKKYKATLLYTVGTCMQPSMLYMYII